MGSQWDRESNHLDNWSVGFERNLFMESVDEKDNRIMLLFIEITKTSCICSLMRNSFKGMMRSGEDMWLMAQDLSHLRLLLSAE